MYDDSWEEKSPHKMDEHERLAYEMECDQLNRKFELEYQDPDANFYAIPHEVIVTEIIQRWRRESKTYKSEED